MRHRLLHCDSPEEGCSVFGMRATTVSVAMLCFDSDSVLKLSVQLLRFPINL